MMNMSTRKSSADQSDLPPIPPGHGYAVGDRVEMPLYGGEQIVGTIEYIDVIFHKKHYKGLVVLGDDGCYYEFHPEIARRLP